jgi:hypothetical protein
MILDREQLGTVDWLYGHGVMYLAISGRQGRDTIEAIERYLPENHLLQHLYDDTVPVWIAVVAAANARYCVDRLASGLIGASAHESLAAARSAAGDAMWRIRS